MARINLTDKFIESDKRIPSSGRVDYLDALVPGLALRVSATGDKSFVLVARYPANPRNPTRRALGKYGALTLEQARVKARDWLQSINKGIDPRDEEERTRALALRSRQNTFGFIAEEFLKRYVKGPSFCELERKAAELVKAQPKLKPSLALRRIMALPENKELVAKSETEGLVKKITADSIIRAEFIKKWKTRPAAEILPEECSAAIRAMIDRGTPAQAHSAFEWLRRIYSWAIGTNQFGIVASPVASLRPSDLIGEKVIRNRILSDDELRTIWNAAAGSYMAPKTEGARLRALPDGPEMGYPYGPLIRAMILTGQREREISDMLWSEIDFDKKLWIIPGQRMKGEHGAHLVPLAPDMLALLKSLPRFAGGDFVFTTTGGRKAVNDFSTAKVRIDELSGVTGWKFHDIRRTARTHFSALPVQDIVRELVIAHAQQGIRKVYDLHAYQEEKRECLRLWEARLKGILSPKPAAEVTDIEVERARRENTP